MKKILLFLAVLFLLGACKKETPEELKQESSLVQKANELLSGDIVLDTKATLQGVDKTLLPKGCPTKFNFGWDKEKQKLRVTLPTFRVGNMPFAVYFDAYATYSEVGYYEKDEYPPSKGWMKFSANNGVVTPVMPAGEEPPVSEGAGIVNGYVNPNTGELEFIINYNMMNVLSHCYKQKIDKSRLANYEQEFKQYEEDLKKYKEEHGIK